MLQCENFIFGLVDLYSLSLKELWTQYCDYYSTASLSFIQ